jgi:hypothetical protein
MNTIKKKIAAITLAVGVLAGGSLAMAGPAAAAGEYNFKETYLCDPNNQYTDGTWWYAPDCNGNWAVGENARTLNIITSYPSDVRISDDWHRTALRSVTTTDGRGRIVHVYCRYADNHLSGLIKTVSIGNGLANTYSFGAMEKCDGVGKGYYIDVTDTATRLTSHIDINTRYSNGPSTNPYPVHHHGSEWILV